MPISDHDLKISELNRFLDELERAAGASAVALERAFTSPPKGVSAHEINVEKKFTRASPGHPLGYRPAELIGRSPTDFAVLKETSESATRRKLSPNAILIPGTRSFLTPDGTEVTLLMVDRQLKDGRGQVIGLRTAVSMAPRGPSPGIEDSAITSTFPRPPQGIRY